MKKLFARFAAALLLLCAACPGAAFSADSAQMREYVEIDGKHYLKDGDGNLIRIEFKPAPVDESRKARPARGRKYGAPHPSTWRLDESKAEEKQSGAVDVPEKTAASSDVRPAEQNAENPEPAAAREPSVAVSFRRADKDVPFIPVSAEGEKSVKAKQVSENGFAVELDLKIKVSEKTKHGDDECSAAIARKVFVVRGEPKTVKLLSFPYDGGCAEYEAEILIQ